MISKRLRLLQVLLLVAFLGGCGEPQQDFVITGNPTDQAQSEATTVARVYLGTGVPGATVALQDASGRVLGSQVSGPDGRVLFNADAPIGGRLVATVPGLQGQLTRRLRASEQRELGITLLTTLADLYSSDNANVSLDKVEDRIRVGLGIPFGVPLDTREPNAQFSSLAFLRNVAAAGGFEAVKADFLKQLDSASVSGQTTVSSILSRGGRLRGYSFHPDLLSTDFSALPAPLAAVAEQARQEAALRLGVARQYRNLPSNPIRPTLPVGFGTDLPAAPKVLAADDGIFSIKPPESAVGSFGFGVLQGVVGNFVFDLGVDGLKFIITGLINNFGQNAGKPDTQQVALAELEAILKILVRFTSVARDEALVAQLRDIENLFTGTKNVSGSLAQDLIGFTPTNQPSATPATAKSLANDVSDNNQVSVDTLTTANLELSGAQGALMNYLRDYTKNSFGLDGPEYMRNLPVQSAAVNGKIYECFNHFADLQVNTMHLLAENAQISFPGAGSPVQNLKAAVRYFNQFNSNIKKQNQILPMAIGDTNNYSFIGGDTLNTNFMFDLETNLIWAQEVFPITNRKDTEDDDSDYSTVADTVAQSQSLTLALPNGEVKTYDDFDLPNVYSYIYLQRRGQFNPTPGIPGASTVDPNTNNSVLVTGIRVKSNQVGDVGISIAGLGNYGFSGLTYYNTEDDSYSAQMWCYGSNDSYINFNESFDDDDDDQGDNQPRPFMACRYFIPVRTDSDARPSHGEMLLFGVPQTLTVTGASPANPNGADQPIQVVYTGAGGNSGQLILPPNTIKFDAEANYILSIGGNYTAGDTVINKTFTGDTPYVGTDPDEFKEDFQQFSTQDSGDSPISTAESHNGNPNNFRDMINWSSSNTDALTIYNLPGISGYAVAHQPGVSVTITASIVAPDGSVISTSFPYTTEQTVSPHDLSSVLIVPRNQIYGGSPTQRSSGTFPYYAIAYFNDQTFEDVTTQVTWNVLPLDNHPNTANLQFIRVGTGYSLSMNQPAQAVPTPWNANVTATLSLPASTGGTTTVQDATTIQIVPPNGAI